MFSLSSCLTSHSQNNSAPHLSLHPVPPPSPHSNFRLLVKMQSAYMCTAPSLTSRRYTGGTNPCMVTWRVRFTGWDILDSVNVAARAKFWEYGYEGNVGESAVVGVGASEKRNVLEYFLSCSNLSPEIAISPKFSVTFFCSW